MSKSIAVQFIAGTFIIVGVVMLNIVSIFIALGGEQLHVSPFLGLIGPVVTFGSAFLLRYLDDKEKSKNLEVKTKVL